MFYLPYIQDGVTALLMASQNGHEGVVRLLLESGAQDMPSKVVYSVQFLKSTVYLTSPGPSEIGHNSFISLKMLTPVDSSLASKSSDIFY